MTTPLGTLFLHDPITTSQPLVVPLVRKKPLLHRDLGRVENEFVELRRGTSTIEKTCFQDDLEKFLWCAYSRLLVQSVELRKGILSAIFIFVTVEMFRRYDYKQY
jgi:hypothetical protein